MTTIFADRPPVAAGVNATLTAQEVACVSDVQVFDVIANSVLSLVTEAT